MNLILIEETNKLRGKRQEPVRADHRLGSVSARRKGDQSHLETKYFASRAERMPGFNVLLAPPSCSRSKPAYSSLRCADVLDFADPTAAAALSQPLPRPGRCRSSIAESLALLLLSGAAVLAIAYGASCAFGLVDNFGAFNAGIEQLLH